MSKTKSVLANPSSSRLPRHRSREFALQGLYEWLLNGGSDKDIIAHISQAHAFDKCDTDHFKALVSGVIESAGHLHENLTPHLDRDVSELSPIEHAVLLIGIYELTFHPEINYRIIINEAIELTKSFGAADGHKFVNGVLDKAAAVLRKTEFGIPAP